MVTTIEDILTAYPLAPPGPLTVEEIRGVDKRTKCDCAMPFVHRKWHRALGTFAELRLCCMAKAVEKALNLPEGSLYQILDFEPTWAWDCKQVVTDGDGTKHELGSPPKWIKDRMQRKGVEIRNL